MDGCRRSDGLPLWDSKDDGALEGMMRGTHGRREHGRFPEGCIHSDRKSESGPWARLGSWTAKAR